MTCFGITNYGVLAQTSQVRLSPVSVRVRIITGSRAVFRSINFCELVCPLLYIDVRGHVSLRLQDTTASSRRRVPRLRESGARCSLIVIFPLDLTAGTEERVWANDLSRRPFFSINKSMGAPQIRSSVRASDTCQRHLFNFVIKSTGARARCASTSYTYNLIYNGSLYSFPHPYCLQVQSSGSGHQPLRPGSRREVQHRHRGGIGTAHQGAQQTVRTGRADSLGENVIRVIQGIF